MDMVSLKASARDIQKLKPRALRRTGQVPAIIYGNKMQMPVQCLERELHKAFVKAGESTLVELDVDGKKIPVLFKRVDFDPISDREIHVDFYAVDMTKEIETTVPVRIEGEAPAVKTLGGVLVIAHDHVKVRCLPKDLPHSISVSVIGLEQFHSAVSVKDLQVPKGVTIMDSVETVIALVQEPRKEEVVATVAAEGAVVEGAAAATGAPGAVEGAATPTAEAQAKDKAAGDKGKK